MRNCVFFFLCVRDCVFLVNIVLLPLPNDRGEDGLFPFYPISLLSSIPSFIIKTITCTKPVRNSYYSHYKKTSILFEFHNYHNIYAIYVLYHPTNLTSLTPTPLYLPLLREWLFVKLLSPFPINLPFSSLFINIYYTTDRQENILEYCIIMSSTVTLIIVPPIDRSSGCSRYHLLLLQSCLS